MDSTSRSSVSARNSARRAAVAFAVALALLLVAAPAFAKKRVVVLGFSGPQSGQAEAAVTATLKKKNTIVSASQYAKAQKKLRIKKLTDKNVVRIANEIGVDAIVNGAVARKGTKWSLVVIVREGLTGKVRATVKIALRGPKIDARAKQDILDRVPAAVAKARPAAGSGGDDAAGDGDEDAGGSDDVATADDGAAGDDGTTAGDDGSEEEAPPPKKKKPAGKGKKVAKAQPEPEPAADDAGASEEEEKVPGVDDVAKKDDADGEDSGTSIKKKREGGDAGDQAATAIAGGRWARTPALDATVGMSFATRSLTFTFRSDLPAAQQPAGYQGSPVPGAYVAAELYPMAFSKPSSALAGLGLAFDFDRVLVLKTRFRDTMGTSHEFNGTQQQWGVGVRYRLPIGKKPTLPTITVGVGYNALGFSIGSGMTDTGVPDVSYAYIDPGLGARFPLGSPRLALDLDARYLIVSSAGAFSNAQNYGPGSIAGLAIVAGLEFRPIPRLPIRLGFMYQRMAFSFDGTGAKSNNLDMDPGSKDVGGALDLYLGGYVTTGYLF